MQTKNLPNAGLLLFSSTYSKGSSKFKYFMRTATQIFTRSNYDHCAILIKCPLHFSGKLILGCDNKPIMDANGYNMKWVGGEYYVFESMVKIGCVVQTLDYFIEHLQSPIEKRSVKIDIQEYTNLNGRSFDTAKGILSLSSQLKKPYNTLWAGYSAFDKMKFIRWLKKVFNLKPSLSKANHCSAYAEIATQNGYEEVVNKQEAILMTPEEVRIKNIEARKLGQAIPFIEVADGNIRCVNNQYFTTL